MSSPKDGGSAFPIPQNDQPGAYPAEPGMSLRDWFAGQAPDVPQWFLDKAWEEAPTLMEVETLPGGEKRSTTRKQQPDSLTTLTAWRYTYADAMLKERDRTS